MPRVNGNLVRDAADQAVLPSITEDQRVAWRKAQGARIVRYQGRYWESKPRGFYHALHWMARMEPEQAKCPSPFCWGYRATLDSAFSEEANGTLPVHLCEHVDDYSFDNIGSKRRNKIRNCQKQVDLVEILEPGLLCDQGYQVFLSAHERTRYGKRLSFDEYCAQSSGYFGPGRGMVLGGIVQGRLGGYVAAYAVGRTAYIDNVVIATDALSTNIGTGLIFELMQACRRAGAIREAVYGLHAPEDSPLTKYKEEMGFPAVHIPTRYWFAPFLGPVVRQRAPFVYYRLTGKALPDVN